jgi:hypothetical protein
MWQAGLQPSSPHSAMSYIAANLVPIVIATLAGLLLGALYAAVLGQSRSRAASGLGLFVVAALSEFWLAAILAGALILAPVQVNPWVVAIGSAVVIWIGFVLPVLVVTHPFRGLSMTALAGDAAHWLIVMVVQAAVLHSIGLTHP